MHAKILRGLEKEKDRKIASRNSEKWESGSSIAKRTEGARTLLAGFEGPFVGDCGDLRGKASKVFQELGVKKGEILSKLSELEAGKRELATIKAEYKRRRSELQNDSLPFD
jgi:hypothetical protein